LNHTKAICGHAVIAVGAPNSPARLKVESTLCNTCRVEEYATGKVRAMKLTNNQWMGLRLSFARREFAAFVWLQDVDGTVYVEQHPDPKTWADFLEMLKDVS
jgi:formate-dependent nitrite reductase cytochrome c552 subunit